MSTWQKFRDWNVAAVDADNLEPEIHDTFLKEFDQSEERVSLVSLIDESARGAAH